MGQITLVKTNTDHARGQDSVLNDRRYVGDRRNDTAEQASRCYGANEVP